MKGQADYYVLCVDTIPTEKGAVCGVQYIPVSTRTHCRHTCVYTCTGVNACDGFCLCLQVCKVCDTVCVCVCVCV